MSSDRLKKWQSQIWVVYRQEMIRAGASEQEADKNIFDNKESTFPNGELAAGNYLFSVVDGQLEVGHVWLADQNPGWFIYDIEIKEELRRTGLGRKTTRLIEEFVRDRGGSSIGLSVFGFNESAKELYLSEGYEVLRLNMKKSLT